MARKKKGANVPESPEWTAIAVARGAHEAALTRLIKARAELKAAVIAEAETSRALHEAVYGPREEVARG